MPQRYAPARSRAFDWGGVDEREILEIGCGTGTDGSRGVGVDLDASRALVASRNGRIAAAADATQLPFADGAFQRVFCEGIFHHMPDPQVAAAIAEMLRVCHPSGRVMIMDSVWPRSPFRIIAWGLRFLDFGRHVRTERQLREILNSADAHLFSTERLTYNTIGLECLLAVLLPRHGKPDSLDAVDTRS
jgi:SAM-dependent methyltransferase